MHATCNTILPTGPCDFVSKADTLDEIGTVARFHEDITRQAGDGHTVTVYRPHGTVSRADWEIEPADVDLVTIDTAERLAGLAAVALDHDQTARARALLAVLLDRMTAATNPVATADPHRYASVAGHAQRRVDVLLATSIPTARPAAAVTAAAA